MNANFGMSLLIFLYRLSAMGSRGDAIQFRRTRVRYLDRCRLDFVLNAALMGLPIFSYNLNRCSTD